MTVEEETERAISEFTSSLTDFRKGLSGSLGVTVSAISQNHLSAKGRRAMLQALASVERACAVFRWASAHAAMESANFRLGVEPDHIDLIVHGRWQNALDYIEGNALAVVSIVARMQETETREGVLDIRQHAKCLVDLARTLDLPRKPRAPSKPRKPRRPR